MCVDYVRAMCVGVVTKLVACMSEKTQKGRSTGRYLSASADGEGGSVVSVHSLEHRTAAGIASEELQVRRP